MKSIATSVLVLAALLPAVVAHGRMVKPAHRGWMGRLPEFSFVPINYDDNSLNAGGLAATVSGPHGVCGDPHAQPAPRLHESNGLYGTFPKYGARAITGCYAPGGTVDITIQITANHLGYFEFGLCKLNGKNDAETEGCFQTLLQPNGTDKWIVPSQNDFYNMKYVLPKDVVCDGDAHCVLRWHYTGGNNWGEPGNGQEQFWNCADIYVSNSCGAPVSPTPAPTTKTPAPTPPITTSTPVTTVPATTTTPVTTAPTPVPSGVCNGNTNTCYWPVTNQVVPYGKEDCIKQPAFVWCP